MFGGIKDIYEKHYKLLVLIPTFILILALVQIGFQQTNTGSFLIKDITLKGGTTLTVFKNEETTDTVWEAFLQERFPGEEFNLRVLENRGVMDGFVVETSLSGDRATELIKTIEEKTGTLGEDDFDVEIIGSALGDSFFKETIIALLFAFLLMGIVVLIYFRVFVPSIAVMLAAFSDIIVTLAIINLLSIKVSTAGLAAFLMLIGYSVDTDILLSTHVLKRKDVGINQRVYRAMKTGLFTTGTTLVAVIVALIISKSEVITEIMTIVFIGLIVDLVFTWLQNAGLLKWYAHGKD